MTTHRRSRQDGLPSPTRARGSYRYLAARPFDDCPSPSSWPSPRLWFQQANGHVVWDYNVSLSDGRFGGRPRSWPRPSASTGGLSFSGEAVGACAIPGASTHPHWAGGGIVAPLLVWVETFGTRPVLLVPTRTSRRHRSTPSLSGAPRCSLRGVLKPKVISRWPRPTAAWQAGRRRRRPRRCGQSRPRLFTVANGVGASGASVIATQTNNHGRPPSPR